MRRTIDRQTLVSMVRGESDRVPLFRFRFGEGEPRQAESIDRAEVEKLVGTSTPEDGFLFVFGCRPEQAEETLRENPCLVRRGGRLVAMNPEKQGPVYLIEQ